MPNTRCWYRGGSQHSEAEAAEARAGGFPRTIVRRIVPLSSFVDSSSILAARVGCTCNSSRMRVSVKVGRLQADGVIDRKKAVSAEVQRGVRTRARFRTTQSLVPPRRVTLFAGSSAL